VPNGGGSLDRSPLRGQPALLGLAISGSAIIPHGPTVSAHHDCRLRGKGQPLEGDFEQTSLSTKSRLGLGVLAGVPARHYSIRWLACRSNEGGRSPKLAG